MSVFISHATQDRGVAERLCSALERAHVPCWIAFRNIRPGASYAESIVEAIEKAEAMVVIASAAANDSPHVLREVEQAVSGGTPILPFKIDGSKPNKSLRYFLSTSQWLDAVAPPLEIHLDTLVAALSEMLKLRPSGSEVAAPEVARQPAPNLNPPMDAGLILRVESGPDAGLVFELRNSRVVIGRAPDCDVMLHDRAMSRTHFGLNWDAPTQRFVLIGFQALNPILVNGKAVRGRRPLSAGDRIEVGSTVMTLEQK